MQQIFQKELIESLRRNGDRTAIENDGQQVSYSQLLHTTEMIVRFLQGRGLGREDRVGVACDDRTDLICIMTGIMNAGCVFVPIDMSLPDLRIGAMLEDLDLAQIISSRRHLHSSVFRMPRASQCDCYEEIVDAGEHLPNFSVHYPEYDPNDSIYIYFTSGSTGRPKGIIGKNSSLLQFLQWEALTFSVDQQCRCSQFISPYFDAFLRDIYLPLMTGGTICIPPVNDNFFTAEEMIPWIDQSGISIIHCVPSVFRIINSRSLTADNFTKLGHIFLSGERIIPGELTGWYNIFGNRIHLVNFYGATETTMIRAYFPIHPGNTKSERIPIGRPISSTELLILNEDLKPCNTLVVGDLYIASEYLTKGYLNNPALTQEKFMRLPAVGSPGMIAFRTGDRARRLIDGNIDLIGREDGLIKLRGIRIELSEIENTLLASKFVKNAVVIKESAENMEEMLLAFVIRQDDLPKEYPLSEMARLYCEKHLPSYMIPSGIIELPAFPLLGNGKIDMGKLSGALVRREIVEPRDEREERLLAIWKELLGSKPVSVMDEFHRVGGHSLIMMRLIGRIHKAFGVQLSLAEVFANLTIRKQAEFIRNASTDRIMAISRAGDKDIYNLSSTQERIYYSSQLDPSGIAYNLPMAWKINGVYDRNRIESALSALIRRHESLRTSFRLHAGSLSQVIHEAVDFSLQEIGTNDTDHGQVIEKCIETFDLGTAPLIRAFVISTASGEKLLFIDIHHIVCDGMSEMILAREFLQLFHGEQLTPLPFRYRDYAEWEYNFRLTPDYTRLRDFWLGMFRDGVPKLALPLTELDADELPYGGGEVHFEVDRRLIDSIEASAGKEKVTKFSILFSLFYLYLARLTCQSGITIGISSSGRFQHELENIVGMFVKTLPISYRINTSLQFSEFIREIHQLLVRAQSCQLYDLASILDELNRDRKVPVRDLFDAMLVFQNFEHEKWQYEDKEFPPVLFENKTAKYPIVLVVSEGLDTYKFRLQYATANFTAADAAFLAGNFRDLVRYIADNQNTDLRTLVAFDKNVPDLKTGDIVFHW